MNVQAGLADMGELDSQLLSTAVMIHVLARLTSSLASNNRFELQNMDDAALTGLLSAEGLPADMTRDQYVANIVQRIMVCASCRLVSS